MGLVLVAVIPGASSAPSLPDDRGAELGPGPARSEAVALHTAAVFVSDGGYAHD